MYTLVSGAYRYLTQKAEYTVLVLGLDNSGKTTLLETLKHLYTGVLGMDPQKIQPTVGVNIVRAHQPKHTLRFVDLGGQQDLRYIWTSYYTDAHALVFVVDSSDLPRMDEASRVLRELAQCAELECVPVLVVANKVDKGGVENVVVVKEMVNGVADEFGARDVRVVGVSGQDEMGVREAVDWLLARSISEDAGDGAGADSSMLSAPPKCWGCQKSIDGGSAIQFADGVWHIDCFQCTTCTKVIEFDSNLLFLADGKPICPECSYCCSLCKKPIFDEAIVTVEGTYHSECFRCTNCKQRIQGKSFAKTSQGVIYCVVCYGERRERKKAARKRREHQVLEEKVLPQLPQEAENAAAAVGRSEKSTMSPSGLQLNGLMSGSSTATSPPTTGSTTAEIAVANDPERVRRRGAHKVDSLSISVAEGPVSASAVQRVAESTVHGTVAASAPTSPIAASNANSEVVSASELTSPPSPLRESLADPDLEAGLAWTEDMASLEKNFVRYSERIAPQSSSDGPRRYSGNVRRGDGARRTGQARIPALKRAASMGKSQRSRATSSASVLGSMVPPGLRSTQREPSVDGREWLKSATHEQIKEELLVNYGQLCRMEASYQKLRDLYASVIDQLLESRESLHQERTKRAEFENILRSYYGYVPPPDMGAVESAAKQHKQAQRSQQVQRSQAKSQQAPRSQNQSQLSRQLSQRRQQQPVPQPQPQPVPQKTRKQDDDSASDADDAIITTVPQKAKRFMWPFGGNSHSTKNPDEPAQHTFHVASTFRASKCDHCQERLKTFTSTVVRCKGCGFVCHQRCAPNVTAACAVVRADGPVQTVDAGPVQIDAMFGRPLIEQAEIEGCNVPWVVRACVEFIETQGLTMEGVYRRSGSTMDIREVQSQVARIGVATNGRFDDSSAVVADPDMDVPSVTSVLKQYFRDLPDPLMTMGTYQMWVDAANVSDVSERISVYRTISSSMPVAHSSTLQFMMQHLKRVANNQSTNKMTTNNLAVVFAPNILHMSRSNVLQDMANMSEINKTVSFLVQHADSVWTDEEYVAGALESMSLSHSMPSPNSQFYGFMQQQRDTGKTSFDMSFK
ncbi:Rho-type gtpase-activating protein [Coemansia sp. RSA 1972]|nr:Rho-type gtpase-activating protein [Coemansia sp. RSA 1972]